MHDDTTDNPFNGPQLQGHAYSRADMAASDFDGVNLTGSRFYAVLSGARFLDCSMSGAQFDDVNLSGTTFNNVNLAGVSVTNANLTGLSISDANLSGMLINGILVSDLLAAYEASR